MPEDTTTSASAIVERLMIGPVEMLILEDGSRTDNRIGSATSVLPIGVKGPPKHIHTMFDETFLVTSGVLRFELGDVWMNAGVGDYIVVPVGVAHTFMNASDAPVSFFSTFSPAYYVNYFREMSRLSGAGDLSPEQHLAIMRRYATEPWGAAD